MASLNNVKIAGLKLRWEWINARDAELLDEEGKTLYYVEKLYRGDGKPVRDAKDRVQYQVHIGGADGELLGAPEPYMPTAKAIAERHFAKLNGGQIEGHWTKRS